MLSLRERGRARARDRLESLLHDELDADSARRAAIEVLRPAVGFDRWCWPLTDPTSALSTSGIGELDFWPSLPRLVALEEHGDLTSKPRLVTGRRASVTLSSATGGDLSRSRRWRDCLRPYGVGDELMTVCRDRHGCWGSLELLRDASDPPFDEHDVQLLHELAPTLGTLLRRSLHHAWRTALHDGRALPPATVIVDAELGPVSWTQALDDWLAELAPESPGLLPPAVYEIGARVLTPPEEATGLPASARIRTANGRCAVIEGARLEGADRGRVAITVREATGDERFDLLCNAYALSARERQVAALTVNGLATKQLAATLFISTHTVQDHLKSIFAKTGARSRGELVSQLTR